MPIIAKYSLNGNANDLVGGLNWTPTNVTWVDWKSNWAGSFNGSSSTFTAGWLDYFWTQNLSVSCIVKINQLPGSTASIFSWVEWTIDSGINDKSIEIQSNWQMVFRLFDWASKAATFSWLIVWQWYHIVWTYNWTNVRIYVNWNIWTSTTASWSFNFTNPRIWLSWNALGTYNRFNWIIDEVEIHNTALSATEVKNLFLYYNWFM
jgi:hypothetical protein